MKAACLRMPMGKDWHVGRTVRLEGHVKRNSHRSVRREAGRCGAITAIPISCIARCNQAAVNEQMNERMK